MSENVNFGPSGDKIGLEDAQVAFQPKPVTVDGKVVRQGDMVKVVDRPVVVVDNEVDTKGRDYTYANGSRIALGGVVAMGLTKGDMEDAFKEFVAANEDLGFNGNPHFLPECLFRGPDYIGEPTKVGVTAGQLATVALANKTIE